MSGHTPLRNVRIANELWNSAMRCADEDGMSLSDVIRGLLADYVRRHERRRREDKDEPLP